MEDTISRQAVLDKFEPWLKVKDYNDGELNMLKAILYEIRFMPPATDKNVGITDMIDRQQAIKALSTITMYKGSIPFNTAVMRIEQLPSAQPEHCGDAVSRNAIVPKLNKMDRYVSAELRLCDTDKKFPQNEVFIVDDVYEEIVEQLPSVQPKRGRWISADAMFRGVPFYCSECGENTRDTVMGKPRWKFCPMCGSRNEVTE